MRINLNGIALTMPVAAPPTLPVPPYQFGRSFGDTPWDAFWNDIVRGNRELWDSKSPFWQGNKDAIKEHFDAGSWIENQFHAFVDLLNANSAEIITMALVLCAFLVMLAPLIGMSTHKWYGRMTAIFLGGAVWRIFT